MTILLCQKNLSTYSALYAKGVTDDQPATKKAKIKIHFELNHHDTVISS